jgi:SAM-dependent methyltransferase
LDFKAILSHPWIYTGFQTILGVRNMNRVFAREHIRAAPGDFVLDIGCGPADILEFLEQVKYLGIDQSKEYISSAKMRFGHKGEFRCEQVSAESLETLSGFNIAIAIGVAHHLDDKDAERVFRIAHGALVPGGRFVTLDGCIVDGQPAIAKFLNIHDRGKYIRTKEAYERLARSEFDDVVSVVREDLLWLTNTLIIMECKKQEI